MEDEKALNEIFDKAPTLIVTHCESGPVIQQNLEKLSSSKPFTIQDHPRIRDAEACYVSFSLMLWA